MSTTMNRATYEQLIRENIEWLRKQPRTLEREHIIAIVLDSITRIYGSAETGGEKAAPYLLQKVTMPLYVLVAVNEFLGDWRKGDFDLPKLASLDAEAIESAIERWASDPNFPRSSQNQTVSSGVDGAHEGTTADKSGSNCKHGVSPNQTTACGNCDEEMREYSLSNLSADSTPQPPEREFLESLLDTLRNSANRFQREGMSCEEVNHQIAELESRLADLREPEKLNNAHYATKGNENMSTQTALSNDDPRMIAWNKYKESAEYQNTKKWALHPDHVDGSLWAAWLQGYTEALAESSLNSPPPEREHDGEIYSDDEVQSFRQGDHE